nr:ATP-grasp domain-containing protein [Solirubrobacterales bacterium]
LVANRGEIARRVFAGCRRLGIATVAVHSDADADAPFVSEADEAVALAGYSAAETYLDVDRLLEAAGRTGADAVHPGYGFLAESGAFARAVIDAGMVWIGPPPEAIDAMGSKVGARALMERAGVPIVPGCEVGPDTDIAAEAKLIGYPLLVKASAGGGGKGMRPVSSPEELDAAVEGARREAEAAFGDPTVFLERYLQRPRHIEIQLLADSHGATVSLGERECSIQRRHQKVLEESPSCAVGAELRERLGAAAVTAAEAVGYVGAGTVEFMVDDEGEFHFLEMNTRLQVEHPVTEMVLGLDLVAEQLRIAAGEPLSEAAREPRLRGHSIEVRLYAEDPAAGHLPQAGTLDRFAVAGAEPFAVPRGEGEPADLRIDSGVESGSVVSPHYDPMLAKLIAWAPSRAEAASRLAAALAGAEIDGLVTNRDLLVRVLRDPAFLAGETDTGFLERGGGLTDPLVDGEAERVHAAAAALAAMAERRRRVNVLRFAPPGFRNNFSGPQRVSFMGRDGGIEVAYAVRREGLTLEVEGEGLDSPVLRSLTPDVVELEVGGVARRYRVRRSGGIHHVNGPTGQSSLPELPRFPGSADSLAEGALVAPMPGKVIKVVGEAGSAVEAGDVLIVLEAMKMEHELTAPAAGMLSELLVAEGDQVDAGASLAVITPPE